MRHHHCQGQDSNLHSKNKGSATSLQIATNESSPQSGNEGNKPKFVCPYCGEAHVARTCNKFWKASIDERKEMVLQGRLCFRCLASGHMAKECQRVCKACGGSHATPLCSPNAPTSRKRMLSDTMPRQTVSYPTQSWSNYIPQMQQQTGITVPSFPTSRTNVATAGQGAQQAVVLAAPSIPYPGLPDASAGQEHAQTVFTPPTGTTTMFTQTPTQ